MRKRFGVGRPSAAMVVAVVALISSLTGGAVAATLITGKDIAKNAVAKKHLKKNAVVSKKVKDGSLLAQDFRAGQLPAGEQGPAGPTGAAGPQGAKGEAGRNGSDGKDFSATSALGSGETISGAWAISSHGDNTGPDYATDAITFAPRLPAAIPDANTHYVASGTSTATCPGHGQAAAGHLCIYARGNHGGSASFCCFGAPNTGSGGTTRYGVILYFQLQNNTAAHNGGTWTVTAP